MNISNFFNQWSNPVNDGRLIVVFENRYTQYGAFQLRKSYNNTILASFGITILFFAAVFMVAKLLSNSLAPMIENQKNEPVKSVIYELPKKETSKEEKVETEQKKEKSKTSNPQSEIINISDKRISVLKIDSSSNVSISNIKAGLGNGIDTGSDNNVAKIIGNGNINTLQQDDNKIENYASNMPLFDGDMQSYIRQNLEYPDGALSIDLEGKVLVSFIVEKDGSLSHIEAINAKKLGFGLEASAIDVIKNMPKWKPGFNNGQAVRVRINIPIVFKIY